MLKRLHVRLGLVNVADESDAVNTQLQRQPVDDSRSLAQPQSRHLSSEKSADSDVAIGYSSNHQNLLKGFLLTTSLEQSLTPVEPDTIGRLQNGTKSANVLADEEDERNLEELTSREDERRDNTADENFNEQLQSEAGGTPVDDETVLVKRAIETNKPRRTTVSGSTTAVSAISTVPVPSTTTTRSPRTTDSRRRVTSAMKSKNRGTAANVTTPYVYGSRKTLQRATKKTTTSSNKLRNSTQVNVSAKKLTEGGKVRLTTKNRPISSGRTNKSRSGYYGRTATTVKYGRSRSKFVRTTSRPMTTINTNLLPSTISPLTATTTTRTVKQTKKPTTAKLLNKLRRPTTAKYKNSTKSAGSVASSKVNKVVKQSPNRTTLISKQHPVKQGNRKWKYTTTRRPQFTSPSRGAAKSASGNSMSTVIPAGTVGGIGRMQHEGSNSAVPESESRNSGSANRSQKNKSRPTSGQLKSDRGATASTPKSLSPAVGVDVRNKTAAVSKSTSTVRKITPTQWVSTATAAPVGNSSSSVSENGSSKSNVTVTGSLNGTDPSRSTARDKTTAKNSGSRKPTSTPKSKSKAKIKTKWRVKSANRLQSDARFLGDMAAALEPEVNASVASNQLLQQQQHTVTIITCEQLKCTNNGLCVDAPGSETMESNSRERKREARCRCQLGTGGKHCEQDVYVKYPRFNSASYIAFPVFTSFHREFLLKLQFRPDSLDGLLLYSVDKLQHYISVSMVNGYIYFRFNLGYGPGLIRSNNSVEIGQWNSLRLDRTIWNIYIKLNEGQTNKGEPKQLGWIYRKNSYGSYQWTFIVNNSISDGDAGRSSAASLGSWRPNPVQSDASNNAYKSNYIGEDGIARWRYPNSSPKKPMSLHSSTLYMGGHQDLLMIENHTGVASGFKGCVRFLRVNDKIYDMRPASTSSYYGDALFGLDIDECNAGVCDNVQCMNGGQCTAVGPDMSSCMCPLGTTGASCQTITDIKLPSFDGHSYLQYIGLRRSVMLYTDIQLVIKPTFPDGLILYNGYSTDGGPGDFLALALQNRTVVFQFDLGSGPATLRSIHPLSLDTWHTIRLKRSGRDGELAVDDQPEVKSTSGGPFTQLTLALDLFIGGHRNFDEVSRPVGVYQGYRGCIQKVVINEHSFRLVEEAVSGINVDNCPGHPCTRQPAMCQNGGQCIPVNDNYQCLCPAGFTNTYCQDKSVRYRYRYF